ncbi:MAG: hypothetical protein KJ847_04240 [Firmicutes bacterium]|nr:hypothetical protein [Bacillota bacterium]
MLKKMVLLMMVFSLMIIYSSSVIGYCSGVEICGVSYPCQSTDTMCPRDYGDWSSCSNDYCYDNDQQCCIKAGWTWYNNACCGNTGESMTTSEYHDSMDPIPSDDTSNCCLNANYCVDNGGCYGDELLTHKADADSDDDYCNNGIWYDCKTSTQCNDGKVCVSSNCVCQNIDTHCGPGETCENCNLQDGCTAAGKYDDYSCQSNNCAIATSTCTDACCVNGLCYNNVCYKDHASSTLSVLSGGSPVFGTESFVCTGFNARFCDSIVDEFFTPGNQRCDASDTNCRLCYFSNHTDEENLCETGCGAAGTTDERLLNTCIGNSGWINYTCGYSTDADAYERTCDCRVGVNLWNLGGDAPAGSYNDCCGDDINENKNFAKYHVSMTGPDKDTTDNACCNAANDCVDNNGCYDHGNQRDADGDGDSDFCNQGTWQDCYTIPFDDAHVLRIQKGDANVVGMIDRNGMFRIKGTLVTNQAPTPSGDYFDFRNAVGTVVASIDESGNLYLRGSLAERQGSVSANVGSQELIVRASGGPDVAIFDSNGNLNLAGCLSYSDGDSPW